MTPERGFPKSPLENQDSPPLLAPAQSEIQEHDYHDPLAHVSSKERYHDQVDHVSSKERYNRDHVMTRQQNYYHQQNYNDLYDGSSNNYEVSSIESIVSKLPNGWENNPEIVNLNHQRITVRYLVKIYPCARKLIHFP